VEAFHPLWPWDLRYSWRPFNRDHRKLLVIDDEIAGLGGLNVGENYAGSWVMHATRRWKSTTGGRAVKRIGSVLGSAMGGSIQDRHVRRAGAAPPRDAGADEALLARCDFWRDTASAYAGRRRASSSRRSRARGTTSRAAGASPAPSTSATTPPPTWASSPASPPPTAGCARCSST
jgi:hypothetical protein